MRKVAVVGLGYVGLPLALEFGRTALAPVIGFDVKQKRIDELNQGIDSTGELSPEEIKNSRLQYTTDPQALRGADFIIVAVPTPIDEAKVPDLKYVTSASKLVGQNLWRGSIVVFESTVYPGVTEDVCVPIIEKESGLRCGRDWKIAYSPERINPGDKEHSIDKITKVVSGMDEETLNTVAEVYGLVCKGGVHRATSVKVAEAAKVIENIQRDLNIALINELTIIFRKMGISVYDVLAAAGTKWNFHKYSPGLVGGHCIGVDPYYLTYKAEEIGYHPQVILAGRRVNDGMACYVTQQCIREILQMGKVKSTPRVAIFGLTFKENVSDQRNSKSADVIKEFKRYGFEVFAHDPFVTPEDAQKYFNATGFSSVENMPTVDAALFLLTHDTFYNISIPTLLSRITQPGLVFDLKGKMREKFTGLMGEGKYFSL